MSESTKESAAQKESEEIEKWGVAELVNFPPFFIAQSTSPEELVAYTKLNHELFEKLLTQIRTD